MKVITSGYFNPIHIGHIRYLKAASELGWNIVIVNNDEQVKLKGSVPFMSQEDRLEIIKGFKYTGIAFLSIDTDETVRDTIYQIFKLFPDEKLVFAKGGDRTAGNIPEYDTCEELGIEMIFGVGGGKIRASSELIRKATKGERNNE